MISFASFSSILVPLRAVFILLALILLPTYSARSICNIYRFFRTRPYPFPGLYPEERTLDGRVQSFHASVKRSSKTLAETLPCPEAIRWISTACLSYEKELPSPPSLGRLCRSE